VRGAARSGTTRFKNRDRVAAADRVALILEETLNAAGSEWTEANLADLHRAGDGEGVTGAGAPGGRRCRED
jgi:hypothetical protein